MTLECDHVLAQANGGSDAAHNLITSYRECNAGKGAEHLVPQQSSNTHVMRTLSKRELFDLAEETDSAFLKAAFSLGINTVLFE